MRMSWPPGTNSTAPRPGFTTISRTLPNTVEFFVARRSAPRLTAASATTAATTSATTTKRMPRRRDFIAAAAAHDDDRPGIYWHGRARACCLLGGRRACRAVPARSALEVGLEVAQRAAHDGIGDRAAHDARHEAAGVDAQVELGARAAPAVDRREAPLAAEVAKVPAEVLAREAMGLVVDLAQPVAHGPHARVDD